MSLSNLSSLALFYYKKLSTVLNNDILQKISNMAEDIEEIRGNMKDMKEAIVTNKEKIFKNSNAIADVNFIAKRNSAQITSVSGQHETMIVNNIQRLNFMDNKMVDMKMNIVRNEGTIVENSDTISDVNSIVERNSAQITSVSEELEKQQAMIVNNINRLDSLFTKMAKLEDIKEEMSNMEEEIVQNSDTISNVNFTAERNSAQITSMSQTRIADNIRTTSDIADIKENIVENTNTISDVNSTLSSQLNLTNNNVLNNEMKIEQMDSTMTLFSEDLDKNKDDVEKELKEIQLTPGPKGEAGSQGPQGEKGEPGKGGS